MSIHPLTTDVDDLGKPLDAFKVGIVKVILFLVGGVLLILVGIVLLCLSAYWFFRPPVQGARGGLGHDLVKLCVFGIAIAAGGVGLLRAAVRSANMRFLVFENGLTQLRKDDLCSVRWDAVRMVLRMENKKTRESTIYLHELLAVTTKDGTSLLIGRSVGRFRELRRLIEERTLPYLLAEATEQMREQGSVKFGTVEVNPVGLHRARVSVPWEKLGRVYTGKGELHVCNRDRRKPAISAPLQEVPNVHVLLALANASRPEAAAEEGAG